MRPLLITFERSWLLGEISEDWKKAYVTPVFKKDEQEELWSWSASLQEWSREVESEVDCKRDELLGSQLL